MGGDRKVFNLAEVSELNTPKDCWLIIEGKVYDVTKFMEDHPGGDDVLLSSTRKDPTEDFEDVHSSRTAKAMMGEYYVGDIDTLTIPTKMKYTPPKQPHYYQDKTPNCIIRLLLILALAVGVRFYTKTDKVVP